MVMPALRTLGYLATFASLPLLILGCSKKEVDPWGTAPPTPTIPSKPVDHLAANELLEGPTKVLDFRLPRISRIETRLGDVVTVSSTAEFARVVAYVEAHTRDAKVTRHVDAVTFEDAHIADAPNRVLKISVYVKREGEPGTGISIFDRTPAPAEHFATDEERLRSVGLRADGKVLDPTKLE